MSVIGQKTLKLRILALLKMPKLPEQKKELIDLINVFEKLYPNEIIKVMEWKY